MFNLAARIEGRNPPAKPMMIAKITPKKIVHAVRAKVNSNSEKEPKFIVETCTN